MKKFYVSLVRGLFGYYIVFEAPNSDIVYKHLEEYFGRLWCSVYSEESFKDRVVGKYVYHIVNEDRPIALNDWRWE